MSTTIDRFDLLRINDEDRRYVERIMHDVRDRGDEALIDYTARPKPFDNVRLPKDGLMVSETEISKAGEEVSTDIRKAILFTMRAIRRIVKLQMKSFSSISFREDGLEYALRFYPLERIGVLVPGGKASYVSTLVMAAYPATLVGVKEIHVLTPPRQDGSINPIILYAASLMGLKRVYRCNMVAGVGALTFGTETISRVDKIFGPGNRFVMLAKMIASSYGISIDLHAGPSELVVLADSSADPRLIAFDIAAQAEHSPEAFVALITNSKDLVEPVERILRKISNEHGLRVRMVSHIVNSIEEGIERCNSLAPEHVSLHVKGPKGLVRKVRVTGTAFLGGNSPPAVGDYASGSNHILPTGGYARVRGGITILDYLRLVSYQRFSLEYLKSVSKYIKALSIAEGLPLHGLSVETRLTGKSEP
ncbi:MAG: histidinol dehydrogenase [Thermoproteota archaeon]